MRRVFVLVAALAALGAAVVVPAGAQPGPGGFTSANVTWIGNIPLDSPAIGGRVITVGAQVRLYVAGGKNLAIYDVTNPELPLPIGTLPLPNWQNEDVEVSADGAVVLVANDVEGVSYLIDASNPQTPVLKSVIPATEHTLTCVERGCRWAYGRSGAVYDLRDRAAPKMLEDPWIPGTVKLEQRVHDLYLDDTGLLFADTVPRLVLDPRRDPARPRLVAAGTPRPSARVAYQHNSLRPNARAWRPRRAGDRSAALRPGELLLANGETNVNPQCGAGSGPFSTWSLRDMDKGVPPKVLDVFRPTNGTFTDGKPPVNVGLGCSGHWFTERNGIVAAGWFEHGTRFLKVAPTTGKISEVGYFLPPVGSASAAHWVSDQHVYVIDYERGIDILRFDRLAAAAPVTGLEASWRVARPLSALAEAERWACKVATEAA